jgi:hypothetical protein
VTAVALETTQAILNALKPNQTAAAWSAALLRQRIDWDDMVVRAIVLGLAPQLHHRLDVWGFETPLKARAKLAVTFQAQAARSQAIYGQLAEFLECCQERSLQPIALKGVHLAAIYYALPAQRPMNDIDLLFRPTELGQAEALLTELGYRGSYKSPDMGAGVTKHTSTFRRPDAAAGATSNPFLSADSGLTIEPHVSLEESWFGLRVDITPGVRQRTQRVQLAGRSCQVLGKADLLLHLCLHFCFHLIEGAPSMVQLGDLLAVTRREDIPWEPFLERAEHYQAAPYALAGLNLAHKLLEAPVPAEVLARLSQMTPDRLRRRIEALELADLLRRTQQKPLRSISQRLQRGWRDRAETARWAAGWRGRWQVWRTLFRPWQSDTGQLLRQRLSRAYQQRKAS